MKPVSRIGKFSVGNATKAISFEPTRRVFEHNYNSIFFNPKIQSFHASKQGANKKGQKLIPKGPMRKSLRDNLVAPSEPWGLCL
jgi:hypothetical protein